MSLHVVLPAPEQTLKLGRLLAESLPSAPPYPALLLQGGLGAGKTTLVRGLVEALPGSEEADVASPSFTLLHLYPTQPECAHFDVYRLEEQEPDASLGEALADDNRLALVEWAQFLPQSSLPEDRLLLLWQEAEQEADNGRALTLQARGQAAEAMLQRLTAKIGMLANAPGTAG